MGFNENQTYLLVLMAFGLLSQKDAVELNWNRTPI